MDSRRGLRYRELLNEHGFGYPVWPPKSSDAPLTVDLGDIVILTDDGCLEYLWNVHLPANHLHNASKVPPDFEPLAPLNESHIRKLACFDENTVFASPSVHVDPERVETRDGRTTFKFDRIRDEGAVLVLPRGASRVDSRKRGVYETYVASNAESWYRYINRDLGRCVENGRLYLVTGTDKCSSWGIASFAKPSGDNTTLEFVASNSPNLGGPSRDGFQANFPIEYRVGATDPVDASHCVFARGFRVFLPNRVPEQVSEGPHIQPSAQATPTRFLQASVLAGAAKDLHDQEHGRVEVEYNGKPPLFALIIGIDFYEHSSQLSGFDNLEGAVADADDVYNFLTTTLLVDTHITVLRNSQATRTAILDALCAMKTNDDIKSGDPIVIFYAGHGSEVPAPSGWPQRMVRMLIPHNFLPSQMATPEQRGILSVTLGRHLEELANAKGTNITLIFDSCHSGGGSRASSLGVMSRGFKLPECYQLCPTVDDVELPESYSRTVDSDVGGSEHGAAAVLEDPHDIIRGSHPAIGFEAYGLSSHVLLAACASNECARECGGRGYFTTALFSVLRASTARHITYDDVVHQLPLLPGQRPQCEGKYRHRELFGGKAPSGRGTWYPVKTLSQDVFQLEAGEIHGFTVDAEFDVFTAKDWNAKAVCRLRTTATNAISSDLTWASESHVQSMPHPAWAVQAKSGRFATFAIAVAPELVDRLMGKIAGDRSPHRRAIRFVSLDVPHELEVKIVGESAAFLLTDTVCVAAEVTELAERVPVSDMDTIYSVIQSAAAFFFYLRLSNADENILVHLAMYKLKMDFDDDSGAYIHAQSSRIQIEDGVIPLAVGPSTSRVSYGFRLSSGSSCDLRVWLFMFDMRTLKIDIMYDPRENSTSLRPGECLTPGYGSVGAQPWGFSLRPGVRADVTYCKAVISTTTTTSRSVDLHHIAQHSPFDHSPPDPKRDSGRVESLCLSRPAWSTILLPIVLKAAAV